MDDETMALVRIVGFIIRIVITVYCVSKAGDLNRSTWGWGLFAFFLPLIAVIWIQFMRPIVRWEDSAELPKE
jgi:hypothetical protein